jgi:hypothetical protein
LERIVLATDIQAAICQNQEILIALFVLAEKWKIKLKICSALLQVTWQHRYVAGNVATPL